MYYHFNTKTKQFGLVNLISLLVSGLELIGV